MIFRNDDVNANSLYLGATYSVLTELFPDSTIYSCTTVFSKACLSGSVYPDLPLKGKSLDYFLEVDKVKPGIWYMEADFSNLVIASHGLWHFDHTAVDYQLKKASIVSSCSILYTDIFVPPFNKWDSDMEEICKAHSITLVKSNEEGWKSLEYNKFDPSHEKWYFHSWRWSPHKLKEYLND